MTIDRLVRRITLGVVAVVTAATLAACKAPYTAGTTQKVTCDANNTYVAAAVQEYNSHVGHNDHIKVVIPPDHQGRNCVLYTRTRNFASTASLDSPYYSLFPEDETDNQNFFEYVSNSR